MLNTIFHIDENSKWDMVNSNIYHLVEWMKFNHENGIIELVINGDAVEMAKKDSSVILKKLTELDVQVMICENSLNQRNILLNEIQDQVKSVSSGVVELSLQQRAGFSYIKP
ncbi:DsrE family protein [Weissella koreensis]|uniref:DsrE family protein n=1 Tax=Weissella koreensis TaxID=165096 RepID=UPI0022BA4D63|nr:DsrE family protein [Weissella koreensis]MCZ9310595.1 DsrE family protein [Weissella koreensis]